MKLENQARLLSVIMPNYNYGRYIAEAIQSLAGQDYRPIELIVVDDASTDNSLEVVEETLSQIDSFERTEVISIKANGGKLAAINCALGKIRGEYSIILDSDDYLTPHYVSRCVTELLSAQKADPRIGFVYTDCTLVSDDGTELDRGKSTAFDPEMIKEYSYVPEPAVVMTRALVEAGPFDVSIRRGTKHHKWRRIVDNGWHGKHLAEPMFFYRMHDRNLSGIGKAVLAEVDNGRQGHRILSGYWPTAVRG